MSGIFILKRDGSRTQFMFNLVSAGNGEIVLTSELYTTKQSAEGGIAAVKLNAPHDDRYKRRLSAYGQPYFTLNSVNGQVVGVSEMYSSEQARDAGIAWVKLNGPSAPTKDQT